MIWSAKTHAVIASAIGTALKPTHGSCLPFVDMVVFFNLLLIVFFVFKIEEVGFTAILILISWPLEMPPKMPPELFDEK